MTNDKLATSRSSRNIADLLNPRSIALIGAKDSSQWSLNVFTNLVDRNYRGAIHLVSRKPGIVHGRQSVESCRAIGQPVDVGILMVPSLDVESALSDLASSGATGAVILSAGYAETGTTGQERQARLSALGRDFGISILGPNCLGYVNFSASIPLWASWVRAPSRVGGVAVVSQSGAVATFLSGFAQQQEIGLSHLVATGNEADLDFVDFLDYFVDDPTVRAIALFVETVRGPIRFIEAARRAFAAKKPIVVLKVGASEVAARSAQSHSGSLVGDDRVFSGVCEQYGIIRVNSLEELLTTAAVLERCGVLSKDGLGIVSVSGGVCEIAADRAEEGGVPLAKLSAETSLALANVLPDFATASNPLDVTGAAVRHPELFERVLDTIFESQPLSALACVFDLPVKPTGDNDFYMRSPISIAAGLKKSTVPTLVFSHTQRPVNDVTMSLVERMGLPYASGQSDRAPDQSSQSLLCPAN